jgi:hypothetical protein
MIPQLFANLKSIRVGALWEKAVWDQYFGYPGVVGFLTPQGQYIKPAASGNVANIIYDQVMNRDGLRKAENVTKEEFLEYQVRIFLTASREEAIALKKQIN